MIRATTGRTARSRASEAIALAVLGTPAGWTLCGYLALVAYTAKRSTTWGAVCALVDFLLREPDHCFKALNLSIERAGRDRCLPINQKNIKRSTEN